MGKKNDTTTPAAAIAEPPKKKTTEPATLEVAPLAAAKPVKAKAAPKRKPAAKKAPALIITTEDIALRAYFIAETRQRDGIHGDSHGDWIEAERQLHKEHKKKKAAKKKPAGARKRN